MIILFMIILSMSIAAADFEFNGTVYDINGNMLNNSNITVLIRDNTWSQVWLNTTQTNGSGFFNITLPSNTTYVYQASLFNFNGTCVNYVGQSLPAFPYTEFLEINDIDFYLEEAGIINISAINSTGSMLLNTEFAFQVKDQKLGYPVGNSVSPNLRNYSLVYVPKNRNYSVMIYPASGSGQNFVPVSFNWNNFTSSISYNISTNSDNMTFYKAETRTINKRFNVTESQARITGYFNYFNTSQIATEGWSEMTVVAYMLEPGDMTSSNSGALPFNTSGWFQGQTDAYNTTSGYYNITLPYEATETVSYILLATAKNGTTYYGGYRNITVTGSASQFNFTLYGMLGSNNTINLSKSDGGSIIVNASKQKMSLVNTLNQTLTTTTAHVEIVVDYSNYGAKEFTFMEELSSQEGAGFIYLPLLNVTGIKEINVYTSDYAPKRVGTKTVSQIQAYNTTYNITMKLFNSTGDIDNALAKSSISVALYRSNATCDIPNPPSACLLTSSSNLASFNPLAVIVGGGRISFRMSYSGITVHYVNVDMLASGPPNALFDDTVDNGTSSTNGFNGAMRFGSAGPTIYDYVLVSMSYVDTAGGLNDSAQVNMSIPYFYGEDSWTTPIWNVTANGTNGTALAGNHSHYNTYSSQWQTLMTNTTCRNNYTSSWFNITNPCHIDTTNNKVWIRLPHFSGTEPTITGDRNDAVIVAASNTSSSSSSSGSAGTGTTTEEEEEEDEETEEDEESTIITDDEEEVTNLETNTDWSDTGEITLEDVIEGDAFEFTFTLTTADGEEEEAHSIVIDEVTEDSVTLTIYSEPQEITLMVEESKSIDLNSDEINDVLITLHSIEDGKADITIKKIGEWAPEIAEETTSKLWLWILIAVAAVIITATVIFFLRKK